MSISVSIVEDQLQTREAVTALLQQTPGLSFMAAYPTAEAALIDIPSRQPDVLLVDIHLPRMSGIECVTQLKSDYPDLLILMLTTYEERELIFESLRAGARGYILKNVLKAELPAAIEQVMAGGAPMSMPIARKLVSFFQNQTLTASDSPKLTQREQEILSLLATGYHNKEIAETVGIALETVRTHIKHIYDKLQVSSRTEATLKYLGARSR